MIKQKKVFSIRGADVLSCEVISSPGRVFEAMERRSFLRSLLVSCLGLLFCKFKIPPLQASELTDEAILQGLLEALIPSDETPGAREADLHTKLAELIAGDEKKKRIYDVGLSAVRSEIERNGPSSTDWDAILRVIAPSQFFRVLRWDAMRLFYSDPVGWETVGYVGPPLKGYRNYDQCGR
jgi:hypothetical protein